MQTSMAVLKSARAASKWRSSMWATPRLRIQDKAQKTKRAEGDGKVEGKYWTRFSESSGSSRMSSVIGIRRARAEANICFHELESRLRRRNMSEEEGEETQKEMA